MNAGNAGNAGNDGNAGNACNAANADYAANAGDAGNVWELRRPEGPRKLSPGFSLGLVHFFGRQV